MVKLTEFKVALIVLSLLVFSSMFVLAGHIVTPTTKAVSEDITTIYNITINNNDTLYSANITRVNITIPSSFIITATGNGSSVPAVLATLSSDNKTFSWAGDGLVMNYTNQSFWFNATAPTSGVYYINVSTTNLTGTTYNSITVTVSDASKPANVSFVTPSANTNVTVSSFAVNISYADNGVLDRLVLNLYNSSSAVAVNTTVVTLSGAFGSYYINYTGLVETTYFVNATVNDSYSNFNDSITRVVGVDYTNPGNTIITPSSDVYINVRSRSFNVSYSDNKILDKLVIRLYNSTNSINTTVVSLSGASGSYGSFYLNFTGLNETTYYVNTTVNDSFGNSNSTSSRFIVVDFSNPRIDLIAPADLEELGSSSAALNYNVSDASPTNCTLILDGSVYSFVSTITSGGAGNTFNVDGLAKGTHGWSVNCTDTFGYSNASSGWTFVVTSASGSASGGSGSGSSTTVSEASIKAGYSRSLYAGNKITFTLGGSNHEVKLSGLTATSVQVTVASTPQTAILSVGESKMFNLDGDGDYDIAVSVNSIGPTQASLTVIAVSVPVTEPANSYVAPKTPITGNAVAPTTPTEEKTNAPAPVAPTPTVKSSGSMLWVWIVIAVLVVVLIVWFVMRRKK